MPTPPRLRASALVLAGILACAGCSAAIRARRGGRRRRLPPAPACRRRSPGRPTSSSPCPESPRRSAAAPSSVCASSGSTTISRGGCAAPTPVRIRSANGSTTRASAGSRCDVRTPGGSLDRRDGAHRGGAAAERQQRLRRGASSRARNTPVHSSWRLARVMDDGAPVWQLTMCDTATNELTVTTLN